MFVQAYVSCGMQAASVNDILLQAASQSPAVSLPTTSPRRISRRDVDLGLPAAPEGSPSPNSLPYQASPDHPDITEENGHVDEEEDTEMELSSEVDTPKVGLHISQTLRPTQPVLTSNCC